MFKLGDRVIVINVGEGMITRVDRDPRRCDETLFSIALDPMHPSVDTAVIIVGARRLAPVFGAPNHLKR